MDQYTVNYKGDSQEELLQLLNSCEKVEKLNLKGVRLTSLPAEVSELNELKELDISYSYIKELPEGFEKLTSLKELNIACSDVQEIGPILKLTGLESLNISTLKLKSLPDEIGEMVNLKILKMNENDFTEINPRLNLLTGLETLTMECSRKVKKEVGDKTVTFYRYRDASNIKKLPDLSNLTNLTYLNLSGLALEEIPPYIAEFNKLEYLFIEGFKIEKLPGWITKHTGLVKLFVNETAISELPEEFTNLAKLTHLDLSFTRFDHFPRELFTMSGLTYLNLNGLDIRYIPRDISILDQLEDLYLLESPVKTLPDEIGKLTKLDRLDLRNSKVTKLPPGLGEIPGLWKENSLQIEGAEDLEPPYPQLVKEGAEKYRQYDEIGELALYPDELVADILDSKKQKHSIISIKNCALKKLPQAFYRLKHINTIFINNTYIKDKLIEDYIYLKFEAEITKLKNLTYLHIINTPLSHFPEEFDELGKELLFLEMRGCKLKTIPRTVTTLFKLCHLIIEVEKVSDIKCFAKLKELETLHLIAEQFKALPQGFAELEYLTDVTLEGVGNYSDLSALEELPDLKYLTIKSEVLKNIPEIVDSCCSLKQLIIKCPAIREIPDFIKEHCSLKKLTINKRRFKRKKGGEWIEKIKPEKSSVEKVAKIEYRGNCLAELAAILLDNLEIERLDIKSSSIKELPEEILQLTKLGELNLHYLKMRTLPHWLEQLTSLRSLDISGSSFRKISVIWKMKWLTSLDISGKRVETLPDEIANLTALERLIMDEVPLKELNPLIGNLTALKTLSMDRYKTETRYLKTGTSFAYGSETVYTSICKGASPITTLPDLSGLTNLESLSLRGLALEELPDYIANFTNLRALYISGFNINRLPDWLVTLKELEVLYVDETEINSLPAGFGELQCMSALNLSYTEIKEFPHEIFALKNLHFLGLSRLKCTELPEELGTLKGLERLHLAESSLTTLPKSFKQLTKIRELDLSASEICSLPHYLANLPELWKNNGLDVRGAKKLEDPEPYIVRKGLAEFRKYCEIGDLIGFPELFINSILRNRREQNPYLSISQIKGVPLPRAVCQLTHLEELYIDNSSLIKETFEDAADLPGGCFITLSGLKISLPPEIALLKNLKTLEIVDTPLANLPAELAGLESLISLKIKRADLNEFSPAITELTSLCHLDIDVDRIEEELDFSKMLELETLTIRTDYMKSLPTGLEKLTNLTDLLLSGMERDIDLSSLKNLPGLRRLTINSKYIYRLPEALAECPDLRRLNINCPKLKRLPHKLFEHARLKSISLNDTVYKRTAEGLVEQ